MVQPASTDKWKAPQVLIIGSVNIERFVNIPLKQTRKLNFWIKSLLYCERKLEWLNALITITIGSISFLLFQVCAFFKVLTKYFGFLAAFLWFLTASLKLACEQAHLCEFGKHFRGGAASANIFPKLV